MSTQVTIRPTPKSRQGKATTAHRGAAAKKPTKKGKGPQRKGLISTILDVGETVAGVLPGAIKGIRGMMNMKEADYSTPASFAVVRNNVTQMRAEERVTHPTLGLAGYRVRGSQPLCSIRSETIGPAPFSFFTADCDAVLNIDTVAINPVLLEGPLSVHGYLNDRFVCRHLRVKFTTYQPTTALGVCALAVEKDFANLVATDFNTARQVTPNVTFPYRIPKAELDYLYDGPDLFFCNQKGTYSSDAEARQDLQCFLRGFDPAPPISPLFLFAGYLEIEYVFDFFDPVPPSALVGTTREEHLALAELRRRFQASRKVRRGRLPQVLDPVRCLENFVNTRPSSPVREQPVLEELKEEAHACGAVVCRCGRTS